MKKRLIIATLLLASAAAWADVIPTPWPWSHREPRRAPLPVKPEPAPDDPSTLDPAPELPPPPPAPPATPEAPRPEEDAPPAP